MKIRALNAVLLATTLLLMPSCENDSSDDIKIEEFIKDANAIETDFSVPSTYNIREKFRNNGKL